MTLRSLHVIANGRMSFPMAKVRVCVYYIYLFIYLFYTIHLFIDI